MIQEVPMPSIRATRDDVTDRFPMLGFTINTGGDPYFEVVLTTDPSLPREHRTPENFFSTRGVGPLRADRGEAVYLVPPTVLRRFAGQQRLWFGLATFRDASRSQAELVRIPTSTSPYVSLRSFGGRSSRRIHITPVTRQRNGAARYQENAPEDLVWAGDDARPGSESIALHPATSAPKAEASQPPETRGNGHDPGHALPTPPSASTPPPSTGASLSYDDGFGELPPVAPPSTRRSRPFTDSLNDAAQRAKDEGANQDEVDEFLSRLRTPVAAQGFAGKRRPTVRSLDGRTEIRLPGGTQIEGWRAELLIVALETVLAPFGAGFAIPALRLAATEAGVSIGLGPAVSGGLLSGGSLGVGIVFAPHNVVGFYGATELSAGLLAGISATLQVTVLRGGLESFSGSGYAVGLSGGEEIVAGAAVILDADRRFQGVSAQVGVGIGLSPVEIYTSAQRGYSTAQGLGHLGVARAQSDEIPLDPGNGGQSIGSAALQVGDIILSTTAAWISKAIRGATSAPVSHAMLYIGDELVVEAIGGGVQVRPLADAVRDATVAVAFRFPGLTEDQALRAKDFAGRQLGHSYDYWGVVRQLPFRLAGQLIRVNLGTSDNDSFFCSELILAAYEAAGIQLTNIRPDRSSPGDLAELRLNHTLDYVGHLKAPAVSSGQSYRPALGRGLRRARPFDNDGTIAFRDRLRSEGLTDEQADQFLAEFGGPSATAQGFRARGRLGASPFDERIQIHLPGATTISGWRARALLVALEAVATGAASSIPGLGALAPAVGSLIASLPAICDRMNVTIGIGPNVAAFPVAGGSIGAGIVFAPGGVIGLYGSGEVGLGVILGISAVAQITIVGGGIANFAGDSVAMVVGGGEGIVGGVAVLFAPDQTFQGVSFQLGVGAGISPIDVYMSTQHTWTTAQGLGLARTGAARALEDDGRVPIRLPRARRLSTTERLALQTALGLAGPLGVLVNAAMATTDAAQVTIGIGPAVEAGLLAGGGLSVGLVLAPGGVIGVYGSVETAAGVLGSISATAQVTIIRGGIEEFGEAGYAIGISGGEELYGGAAALFTQSGVFHGVSVRLGIGAGVIPIDIFVAAEQRFASPPPSPAPATSASPAGLTTTSRRDRLATSPQSRPTSARTSRPVGRPLTELGPAGDPAEEEGYEEESAVVSAAQTTTECTDDHCPVTPAATAGTVHFSLAEFQCRDGTPVPERFRGNAQQVMENLEVFRSEIGDKAITIVSGYRTCAYNSTLEGAASRSRHLCSQAADIRVTDLSPLQVRDIIERLIGEGRMHQGGLGLYDTFVHYDVRGTRARWDRRRRAASASAARSLGDPGAIVPDYSQAASTAQAIGMFFEWLQAELKFRIGVPSTAFFPHSAICKLRLLGANGDLIGEGSGFYIGHHRLLTAGHCLVNDDGSRVHAVEVIPGMHGNSEPFGGATVALSALKPHPRYNPAAYDPSFDIGVITAAPDAPHGEFFEMEELRMSPNTGIITCGYAAVGVDPRVQHMDVDTIRELHNGTFTYAAQVRQGSSGGPVFYALDSSHIRVVGLNVTTYDAQQNRGLRLTDELITWINSQ